MISLKILPILILLFINLIVNMVKHGEYKPGRKWSLWTAIIEVGIWLTLLWFAGLFD